MAMYIFSTEEPKNGSCCNICGDDWDECQKYVQDVVCEKCGDDLGFTTCALDEYEYFCSKCE